jgi:hypothetical protein
MDTVSYDRQKESSGGLASIVWIASTCYLFATSGAGPGLMSWQALVFALPGAFVAAIVIGIAFYTIQRGVAKVLSSRLGDAAPNDAATVVISILGIALMLTQIVATFLAAKISYTYFFV